MKRSLTPSFSVFGPPFAVLGLLLALVVPASGQVSSLQFSDGTGTASYDQYAGVAGGGWASGWTVGKSQTDITASASVLATNPLYAGGGNYLRGSMTSLGSGTNQVIYRRQIDATAVNLSQAFSYSFYLRPESSPLSSVDSAQYLLFSNTVAASGPGALTTSWSIQSSYSAGAGSSFWQIGNGGGSTPVWETSTMAVTAGSVYFFTVKTDPLTKTYAVTIDNLTNATSYSVSSMAWRSSSLTEEVSFVHFGTKDGSGSTADTVAFSLDNISVSQVPEPAATVFLIGAGSLLVIGLVRRRRA